MGDDPWTALRLGTRKDPIVRQGYQPDRLRCVRLRSTGYRRPGSRIRNGLDQQERPSFQGCCFGGRRRSDDSGNR